ncbi:MAG TPA: aspartyl protease family protein [Verrucomicrobiae bacterium]
MAVVGTTTALLASVRVYLCAVLFFAAALLQAQAVPSAPAEFPFEFHDGFLWVKVSVPQSAVPLNFLLDTGASASVINLETAQRLKLNLGRPVAVQGVESMTKGFWPQKVTAKANGVPLQKNYLAVDLEQLGQVCNCCVDGLIGADFFHGKIVQIDFAQHKIRLLKLDEEIPSQSVVPLKMRPCGMEAPVQVNGGEPKFARLDTGCASALQWVTADVQPEKCSQRMAVALSRFKITEMKSDVRFGNAEFHSVPTGIHADEIFAGEGGLIGNGLLSHFKTVTIVTKRSQLILGERVSD